MKRWSYWIKDVIKLFILFFVASILYGLFMSTIVDTAHEGGFSLKDWVNTSFNYGLYVWLFLMNMINVARNTSMVNIALSMGETRKNCLIGINISNISGICAMMILSLILCFTLHGQFISLFNVFITIPCLLIFASGMGLCINSLNTHGSLALNGMQTFLIFLDVVLIFVAAISTNTWSFYADVDAIIDSNLSAGCLIITAILGITFYIIGNIRMRTKISVQEVSL